MILKGKSENPFPEPRLHAKIQRLRQSQGRLTGENIGTEEQDPGSRAGPGSLKGKNMTTIMYSR